MIPPTTVRVTVLVKHPARYRLQTGALVFEVPADEVWSPAPEEMVPGTAVEVRLDGWWVHDTFPSVSCQAVVLSSDREGWVCRLEDSQLTYSHRFHRAERREQWTPGERRTVWVDGIWARANGLA